MAHYYLNHNRQQNGDYEVHADPCIYMPAAANREYLGSFVYCSEAVSEAKRRHPTWYRINGCYTCSNPCHTS